MDDFDFPYKRDFITPKLPEAISIKNDNGEEIATCYGDEQLIDVGLEILNGELE